MTSPAERPTADLVRGAATGSGRWGPEPPAGLKWWARDSIGGSLGLALRRRGWHVTGTDHDRHSARQALAEGVLDEIGDDRSAEVVFVATPAASVATVARAMLLDEQRRPDTVVTDVSGVKASVVDAVGHARFVGGHPMAGSEQVGLAGADPDLFVGAVWVLTPTPQTDLDAFARLQEVVSQLGAEPVALTPADHDRLVAVVSHVPHLVAATLMNAATTGAPHDAALLRLAAGGFRDMTRVAAGHPGIWPDVCNDNAPAIVASLDTLLADLHAMRQRIASHDRQGLLDVLHRASAARRSLPAPASASRRPGRAPDPRTGPPGRARRDHPHRRRLGRQHLRHRDRALERGSARSCSCWSSSVPLPPDCTTPSWPEGTGAPSRSWREHRQRRAIVPGALGDLVRVRGGLALDGTVRTPGDKSISHRALLLAALSPGNSVLWGLSDGDDVRRTRVALEALGVQMTPTDGALTVHGGRDTLHDRGRAAGFGQLGDGHATAGRRAGRPPHPQRAGG